MSPVWTVVFSDTWSALTLQPPANLTLRRAAARLQQQGQQRNTLAEMMRLNPQYGADEVLSVWAGNLGPPPAFVLLWSWALIDRPDPGSSSGATVEPYLRMGQRNDGLGPRRHPRLRGIRATANSIQAGRAPRVGRTNRYR